MIERGSQYILTEATSRVEYESRFNGHNSLEEFILGEIGLGSLGESAYSKHRSVKSDTQIPLFAAKDIVAVDSIETSLEKKLILLGYRFWHNEPDYELGNYDLVKKLLPEGLIRIDDTVNDVLNSDELIDLYEKIDTTYKLTNKIIKAGKKYFFRYSSGINVVSKLINYGLDESRILELEENINKYTYKTVSPGFYRFEDENLNELEILSNLGFLYKEIQDMLSLTEHETLKYLRALYYLNRATPIKEHVKRSNKRKRIVKKIEDLRQQNENISAEEISTKLNITVDMAKQGIQTLIVLKRTKPINKSYYMRKMHNTNIIKEDLREILRNYLIDYPNQSISYNQIHQAFTYEISDYLITNLYKEISQEEAVPRTKAGASKAAEKIIIDLFRESPNEPLSIYQLSKQYNISYQAVKRGYEQAIVKGNAPPLAEKGKNLKKEMAIEVFRSKSMLGNCDYLDLSAIAKDLRVKRSTLQKWYREISKKEDILPTKIYFYKEKRKEALGKLKNYKINYPGQNINLVDLATDLGVSPDAVRRWYRELSEKEELPPIRLSYSSVKRRREYH